MASGSLVDGSNGGNNGGSLEKHRWHESNKVYTRKSFNKGSRSSSSNASLSNSHPNNPPPSSSNQTLDATDAVNSSTQQKKTPPLPPPPENSSAAAVPDDDSSSLHSRPSPNQIESHSNGERRFVTISTASRRNPEVRDLRRKLTAELDQVRALVKKFESKDVFPSTPVLAKRANSEVASAGPLCRHLSVLVPATTLCEKEKRTPKANRYYRNSDFLLGKEKLPPSDSHKMSKSNGTKTVDHKLYNQAFKYCFLLLQKLMKHKHGWVFNYPVDMKALGLHDYHIVITHPMDLGTVKSRLNKNRYKMPEDFAEDVRLTFRNAMTYNPKGQDVHVMAEQLAQIFEERWPAIEAEYTYLSSPRPPVPTKRPLPPHLPPVDTRKFLERSDSTMHPVPVVDSGPKPDVGLSQSLKKPKAKDPHKRDMTFEEKQRLSNNLQNLPAEKLDNIVQIIKKRTSSLSQHDDEIEVDIDSVDTETLWELDRFMVNYKKSLSKNKKKAELAVFVRQERVQEISDPATLEVPKDIRTVGEEKDVTSSSPAGGEKKSGNGSGSSSSSSSSSGSGSSSIDSDSESSSACGSDAAQSPRT